MSTKTIIKKGASKQIKSANISPRQAQKISKALRELQSIELPKLTKMGKVKKMNVPYSENLYMYRAGMNERVLFTTAPGTVIIHDIVDVKNEKSIKALLATQDD